MRRLSWILCLVLLSTALLGGCKRQQEDDKPVIKVTIMTTIYPLAELTRQIGGEYVDVSWIVEGGQSLANVELSPDLRGRLNSADMVISNGINEPWASSGFSDPLQQHRIIRLDLLPSAASQEGYLWLDPLIVKDLVNELCFRLTVLRPKKQKYFQERRDDYLRQLDELMQKYQSPLEHAQTKQILVLGLEFNAMLSRFSLYSLFPVAKSPLELNDVDIAAIKRASNEKNTHLLLVSTETPQVVASDLEVRASVQVVRIDCLGSSSASGHTTYLDMMRYDLDQLLHATTVQ
ncbi:MAG TPA: metal ABC transporter substrate-binding protein [Tepidisphaeraceae bacterium]|nr:metal ABC transporter substrate-binding protein [Tepidisphaeraceae bacterium]